jgi:hypothetical protein
MMVTFGDISFNLIWCWGGSQLGFPDLYVPKNIRDFQTNTKTNIFYIILYINSKNNFYLKLDPTNIPNETSNIISEKNSRCSVRRVKIQDFQVKSWNLTISYCMSQMNKMSFLSKLLRTFPLETLTMVPGQITPQWQLNVSVVNGPHLHNSQLAS